MQLGASPKATKGPARVYYNSVELYVSQKEIPYIVFKFDVESEKEFLSTRYYVPAADIAALNAMIQMLKNGQVSTIRAQIAESLIVHVQRELLECTWQGKAYINDHGNISYFILPPDTYFFCWAGWSNPTAPILVSEKWGRPQATAVLQVVKGQFAGTRVRYVVGASVQRDSKRVVRSLPSNNLAYVLRAFLDESDLAEIEQPFPDDQAVFVALDRLITQKRRLVKGTVDAEGKLIGQSLMSSTETLPPEDTGAGTGVSADAGVELGDDEDPVYFAWNDLAVNMDSISTMLGKGRVELNGVLTEDGTYIARNVLAPIVNALQSCGFNIKRKWRDPTCSPDAVGLAATLIHLVGEEVLSRDDNLMYVGESDQSHQALEGWAVNVLRQWDMPCNSEF